MQFSRSLAAFLVVPAVILAGCSSSHPKSGTTATSPALPKSTTTSTAPGSPPTSAPISTTGSGVQVSGAFGITPTITVPATAAPTALTQQIVIPGTGAVVAKGDTLIAQYVGQTWAPANGKANVFDSSFAHSSAAAVVVGAGRVLPGWDKTLVGKKLGTRLLLTLPPADGYGKSGQPSVGITATSTLVFVIDLVSAYKPDASAPGTIINHLAPSGFPEITNVPARKPEIISTKGVKAPAKPISRLVVTGSGAKIDAAKTLVLQLVKADLATGKNSQATWGHAPQVVVAKSVLLIADKLAGQNVGSRAVVLVPASPATAATSTQAAQPAAAAEVLVIDVVGQF